MFIDGGPMCGGW